MIGSMIGYGVGYLKGDEALMRHTEGGFEIPMQKAVGDFEQIFDQKEGGIDFSINGRVVNDHMTDDNFTDDPQMLKNIHNLMEYGDYANLALGVTKLANTGIQMNSAFSKGQAAQTSQYFEKSIIQQGGKLAAKLGAKTLSALEHAESSKSGQSARASQSSNQSKLPMCTPPPPPQPPKSTIWQSIGSWFSKTFSRGKKK